MFTEKDKKDDKMKKGEKRSTLTITINARDITRKHWQKKLCFSWNCICV